MLQRGFSFESYLTRWKKVNYFPTRSSTELVNLTPFVVLRRKAEHKRTLLSDKAQTRLEDKKKQERKHVLDSACSSFPTFLETLSAHDLLPFQRVETTTVQVNVGLLCNQTCHHCHVEAGPTRKRENMQKQEFDQILKLILKSPAINLVDITGGAPELNPNWKGFVKQIRDLGLDVIDRCNLTVLFEPGMDDVDLFMAEHKVQVVASLPCYSLENVDKQRGKGVFDKSITALQKLNKLGYGMEGSGLVLGLVYNPLGAFLPPLQKSLEAKYKSELAKNFGIKFNHLFTITNMPIKRFADSLYSQGKYKDYMSLLVNHFNSDTVEHLMCRNLVSISWDGRLYDCDFNQMLELPIGAAKTRGKANLTIYDLESFSDLKGNPISTDHHCYACTAGSGSSCGGAVV